MLPGAHIAAPITPHALWAAALTGLADAVMIVDMEGRLVDFNDAFVRMNGFNSREECARTLSAYPELLDVRTLDGQPLPPEQWPAARALRGETGQSVDLLVRRRADGERWFASVSFSPILDEQGRLLGAVGTARDVTAIKKYRAELENSRAALRRLLSRADRAQEQEQRRIAAELHDDLQQLLGAVAVEATPAVGEDTEALRGRLDQVRTLAARGVESIRRIVRGLRPEALDQLGLPEALRALAREFERLSGLPVDVDLLNGHGGPQDLPPRVATALYRIAQEALHNVHKHARARHVALQLDCSHPDLVALTVRDDGIGLPAGPDIASGPGAAEALPPTDLPNGSECGRYGLLGMRERLIALEGTLSVEPAEGGGTKLRARVPLAASAASGRGPERSDIEPHALGQRQRP